VLLPGAAVSVLELCCLCACRAQGDPASRGAWVRVRKCSDLGNGGPGGGLQGSLALKMSLFQTRSRRHAPESPQARLDVHQLHIHRLQPPAALLQRSCDPWRAVAAGSPTGFSRTRLLSSSDQQCGLQPSCAQLDRRSRGGGKPQAGAWQGGSRASRPQHGETAPGCVSMPSKSRHTSPWLCPLCPLPLAPLAPVAEGRWVPWRAALWGLNLHWLQARKSHGASP